jgi:hypothetical protein
MIDNIDSVNLTSLKNSSPNQSETSIESTEPLIEESNNRVKLKKPLILFVVSFALVLSPLSVT